jgi:CBS domain-containing protein
VLKDRVRSVMTEGVLTCSADDRVGAIMAAMVARRIRHIPVVDASHIAQWESLCRGRKLAILRIVPI